MACYLYNGVKYTEAELVDLLKSKQPKTRRILELQSDLFQKGRDKSDLTKDTNVPSDLFEELYIESQTQGWTKEQFEKEKVKIIEEYGLKDKVKSENQFLQLLNKDNNWVTFFVKSIIQDSAKKGYEKIIFPTGNTASKIEGHQTLEEFKKQKEDRIKQLEEKLSALENDGVQGAYDFSATSNSGKWNSANNELLSLVQDNRKAFAIYKFLIGDMQTFKEIVDFLNERGIEIPYTDRMKRADETMTVEERQSAIDSYNNSVSEKTDNKNQVEKDILSENNLQDETEYTPQELIEKYPLTGVQKVIWNLIKDIVNKLGIKVKFSSSRITEGFDGSNNPQNGEILIRPSTLKNGRFGEVLVHEVVHALTTKIISRVNSGVTTGLTQKQINAVKGLMKLYEAIKADNNLENKYPVKDVFEFIAHLTNETFVKELESKDKNFLQKVFDFILDILGINNANDLSKKYLIDIISDGTFLEENGITVLPSDYGNNIQGSKSEEIQNIKNEINQLKQELERVETEGFGALKPIYNFYETTVTNILKKQGYNPTLITDEYGNTWNEVTLVENIEQELLLEKEKFSDNLISENDKIIWGHPGIGKTYLRKINSNIIDFDSDYKNKINIKYNLKEGFQALNDWRKNNNDLWGKEIKNLWIKAKEESKKTGKILIASDMILLKNFPEDFNKIINISNELFIERSKQRNDFNDNTQSWKNNINKTLENIDKSKIITTDKYISELIFVKNKPNNIREKYFDGKDSITSTEILKKISESNHALNKLAEHLIPKIVEDIDIKLNASESVKVTSSFGDVYAAAWFNPTDRSIIINEFANVRGTIETTILHEIIHSLTYYGIRDTNNINIVFKQIYQQALNNIEDKTMYALTNLDEFIVGIFTDSRLIKELEKIPPISKLRNYKNLFEEVFDRILMFLGIKKKNDLYQQAFSVATNIIEEQYINEKNFKEEFENYQPEVSLNTQLKKSFGIHKKELSYQQTINVKKNVEKYNKQNGTSYFVEFTKVGQADLYTHKIVDKAFGQTKMVFDKAEPTYEYYSDKELIDMLRQFAEKHNISIEVVDNLLLNGMQVDGLASILNRMIKLSNGANSKVLTEEVAHFAIELLGDNHPDVKALMDMIENTPEYYQVKEDYSAIYKTEDQFKKEAIGKLLTKAILNNFKSKQNKERTSTLKKLFDSIIKLFKSITNKPSFEVELNIILDRISSKVINNNLEETNEPLNDLELAAALKNETDVIDTIHNLVKNRLNHYRTHNKDTSSIGNRLARLKEAEESKDINTILKILNEQVNDDISGYLNSVNASMPSLKEQFIANRNNFQTTSEVMNDLYLFINNYTKALNDVISYYTGLTNVRSFDDHIQKIKNAKAEIEELRVYYNIWEEKVLNNVLKDLIDDSGAPYNVKELLSDFYDKQTTKDASWFRLFLGSARLSSNPLIRLMFNKINSYLKVINNHTSNVINKQQELYEKALLAGYTDDMFLSANSTTHLISEYKLGEFKALELKTKLSTLREILKDNKDSLDIKGDDNDSFLSLKDLATTDELKIFRAKMREFEKENYSDINGDELSDEWFNLVSNGMILQKKLKDKWKDNKFDKIKANIDLMNYYNSILELRKEHIKLLPKDVFSNVEDELYLLPQIPKNFIDTIKNKGSLKEWFLNKIRVTPDEISDYNNFITDYFGNEYRSIPIRFIKQIKDNSTDIFYLYGLFAEMSKNYQVMAQASHNLEFLKRTWSENKQYKTKSKSYQGDKSNDFKVMENLILKGVYGVVEDKIILNIGDKSYNVAKVIRKLISYTTSNNLGFNLFSAVSNNIKANIDNVLETRIGKLLNKKDHMFARSEFLKNGPAILTEAKTFNPKNKMYRIMLENNVFDKLNKIRNSDSNDTTKLFFDGGFTMLPFEISEFNIKSRIALSVMHSFRIHEGKLITIKNIQDHNLTVEDFYKLPTYYENYTDIDGKLKQTIELSDKEKYKVQNKIEYLSNLVDGKMTHLERGLAYNNAIASLFLNHRSWLVSGIDRRFKHSIYNDALGEQEIGYYRAFGKYVYSLFKDRETGLRLNLASWDSLTPEEKIGVQKTIADLVVLSALVGIWALLQGIADDEDEWVLDATAYLSSRVLLEHASFISPTEAVALMKTPFAAADKLDLIQDLFLGVFKNRDVDRGAYKGYSTTEKNLIKLIPVIRQMIEMKDPAVKNKYIKSNGLQLFSLFDPTKD